MTANNGGPFGRGRNRPRTRALTGEVRDCYRARGKNCGIALKPAVSHFVTTRLHIDVPPNNNAPESTPVTTKAPMPLRALTLGFSIPTMRIRFQLMRFLDSQPSGSLKATMQVDHRWQPRGPLSHGNSPDLPGPRRTTSRHMSTIALSTWFCIEAETPRLRARRAGNTRTFSAPTSFYWRLFRDRTVRLTQAM